MGNVTVTIITNSSDRCHSLSPYTVPRTVSKHLTCTVSNPHVLCKACTTLLSFTAVICSRVDSACQRTPGKAWSHFGLSYPRASTGIFWVEVRAAANHLTMHRTVPTAKNLAPNVNNVKVEISYFTDKETQAQTRVQPGSV